MNASHEAALVAAAAVVVAGCAERPGAPPELGAAVVVAEAGASNPTLAADPSTGVAYVAWVGTRNGSSDVLLSTLEPGAAPAEPLRVNDIPGDAAPHLQAPAAVAVGPEGNVYVAWTNSTEVEGRRFPSSNLRFARSTDGGLTFAPALTVNDDADGPPASHTFHDVAVASDGTVVVSWLDSRLGDDAPGPDVRIATSTDGGASFSPSRVVDRHTCPCCRTAMALAPDGSLYLAWRELFPGDVRDIVIARSSDLGETWAPPVRVAADDWVFPGCPHAGPSLVVDAGGTLHVAWYTGRPEAPGLYYTTSSDGASSFASARPLLTDEWVPPSQVTLAAAPDGQLWAAWEDRRSADAAFRYLARGPGETLDPSSALPQSGTSPVLAMAGSRTMMAWLDGSRILLRRSPPG